MKRFSVILALLLFGLSVEAALLDHANNAYSQGDVDKAINLYKKAALAGENPALCYFNLANAYVQLDSLPQSIVYYRACLSYAPDFFRGYLNLAIAYFTLEDLGACIATVKRALELRPADQKSLLILAASYRKAGSLPEAICAFERLVVSYPELEEPYIALAEMYRDLGDNQTAIRWLRRYPESGKSESYVNSMLADIYESGGDLDKALYHLQRAFEMDLGNRWALYRIVQLHQKMGNPLVALEQAGQGLEILPTFAELALLAGNIAFGLGKLEEAERHYSTARTNGSAGAVVGLENIRLVRRNGADIEPEVSENPN